MSHTSLDRNDKDERSPKQFTKPKETAITKETPWEDRRKWWKELSLKLYPLTTIPHRHLTLLLSSLAHTTLQSLEEHRGSDVASSSTTVWRRYLASLRRPPPLPRLGALPSKGATTPPSTTAEKDLGEFLQVTKTISEDTQHRRQKQKEESDSIVFAASTAQLFYYFLAHLKREAHTDKLLVCIPGLLVGPALGVYQALVADSTEGPPNANQNNNNNSNNHHTSDVIPYDVTFDGNDFTIDGNKLLQHVKDVLKQKKREEGAEGAKQTAPDGLSGVKMTTAGDGEKVEVKKKKEKENFLQRFVSESMRGRKVPATEEDSPSPSKPTKKPKDVALEADLEGYSILLVFCDVGTKSVDHIPQTVQLLEQLVKKKEALTVVHVTSPTVNIGNLINPELPHPQSTGVDLTIVSLEGPSLLGGALGVFHPQYPTERRKHFSEYMQQHLPPANDSDFHVSLLKQLALVFMSSKFDYALVLFYLTSISLTLKASAQALSQVASTVLPKWFPPSGSENKPPLQYSICKDQMMEWIQTLWSECPSSLKNRITSSGRTLSTTTTVNSGRTPLGLESVQQLKGLLDYLYTISTDAVASMPIPLDWVKKAIPRYTVGPLSLGSKQKDGVSSSPSESAVGARVDPTAPYPVTSPASVKGGPRIHMGNQYFLKKFIETQLRQVDAEVYSYWSFVKRMPSYIVILNGDRLTPACRTETSLDSFDPLASVPLFSQFLLIQTHSENSATKVVYRLRESGFAALKGNITVVTEDGSDNMLQSGTIGCVLPHCSDCSRTLLDDTNASKLVCIPFSARMNTGARDTLLQSLSTMPREWFTGAPAPGTLKDGSSSMATAIEARTKVVNRILHLIEERHRSTPGKTAHDTPDTIRVETEKKLFKEPFPLLAFLVYGLQLNSLAAKL